jgi:hypothetical protein
MDPTYPFFCRRNHGWMASPAALIFTAWTSGFLETVAKILLENRD